MCDAVALDYQPVTVIVDATAAATPDIHLGMYFSISQKFLQLTGTLFAFFILEKIFSAVDI